MERLQKILAKYEIPVGLVAKLMGLQNYQTLYFIIDDSGSMTLETDSNHANGKAMTRWEEAFLRMKSLIEIMAYVPTQQIIIRFLNRPDEIIASRHGEAPEVFIQNLVSQLDLQQRRDPSGGTPALRALRRAVQHPGTKSIYFFGDGQPDRGEQPQIEDLFISRREPEKSPVTFLSCTGEDEQVKWF